jgi:hypothetical protein
MNGRIPVEEGVEFVEALLIFGRGYLESPGSGGRE